MEFPDHVSDCQLPKYYSAPCSETVNMKQLSLEKRKIKKINDTAFRTTPDTSVSITVRTSTTEKAAQATTSVHCIRLYKNY